jgi:hypothetical protein
LKIEPFQKTPERAIFSISVIDYQSIAINKKKQKIMLENLDYNEGDSKSNSKSK